MPRGPRQPYVGQYAGQLGADAAAYTETEQAATTARDKLIATILDALDDGASITEVARLTGYSREYLSREVPKWKARASRPDPAARTISRVGAKEPLPGTTPPADA